MIKKEQNKKAKPLTDCERSILAGVFMLHGDADEYEINQAKKQVARIFGQKAADDRIKRAEFLLGHKIGA